MEMSSIKQRGGKNIVVDADSSGIVGVATCLHSIK